MYHVHEQRSKVVHAPTQYHFNLQTVVTVPLQVLPLLLVVVALLLCPSSSQLPPNHQHIIYLINVQKVANALCIYIIYTTTPKCKFLGASAVSAPVDG